MYSTKLHPLATVIRAMGDRRETAALHVRGDRYDGTIWFHDGDITWARIAGRAFYLDDVFEPAVLLEALISPTSDHDLGTALVEAGADEDEVIHLVAGVVEDTLTDLFQNRAVKLRANREGHWFGNRFRFDARHWAGRFAPADRVDIDLRVGMEHRLSA